MAQQNRRQSRRLAVICDRCGSRRVVLRRGSGRMAIRCEVCGARVYACHTGPASGSGPGQIERELLSRVREPAAALYVMIRRYVGRHGYAPTLREMQAALGYRSVNAVSHQLKHLEAAGLIERDYAQPRGLRLPHRPAGALR